MNTTHFSAATTATATMDDIINTNSADCKLPPIVPPIISSSNSNSNSNTRNAAIERTGSFESSILTEDEGLPPVDLIQIVVKRTGGGEAPCLELSIEKDATVMDLKTLIQDELADESPCLMVPVDRQRLLYHGKMLTNDTLKLVAIKMKVGAVNYIHLAPLPKNTVPSSRTPLENREQSSLRRRQKSRMSRMDRPYHRNTTTSLLPNTMRRRQQGTAPSTTTPSTTMLRPTPYACSDSRNQAFHHMMAPQSLFPSLDVMLSGSSTILDDSVLTAASNELMPLCRVINSNISQILQCDATTTTSHSNHSIHRNATTTAAIDDEHTMLATEQTILLLDQLAQRSSTLARSLRTNLREQRHQQLLSARELLEDGLPWGNY